MIKQSIIEELIDDLCLLTNDGLPDLKSSQSLSYISEFFTSRGMSEVGNNLIQSLTEADQFSNPALNKVIQYKTVNGEDAEGKVGNLLRRPKEEDAHQKALAAIGGEGSDTYKKAMDDLGGENQPQRDIEKEKEKSADAGAEAPAEKEQPKPNAFDANTSGGKAYLDGLPDNDPAKPDSMKSDSEKTLSAGSVVYSVGGGYYADTPGGTPKYRKPTEEGIDKNNFKYILESEGEVVKKVADGGGETVSLVVIGDDETEKAKSAVEAAKFDNLSATEKAKVVAQKIADDDQSFEAAENKEAHSISLIQNRNTEVNSNVMLPPGNPGSSFAENNGAFYIKDVFAKGGELTEEDKAAMLTEMLNTPLAKSMTEADAKRWAKIALETAITEARVLLTETKYNAKNPQPEGFPCGSIMDKQNKASVERLLKNKLEEARQNGDTKAVEHYETQLRFLETIKETDTGVLYMTNDGTIGFKHTSNKSSYDDPHNNTSPAEIINSLRKELGDTLDPQMEAVFTQALDKLANASSGIQGDVDNFNKSREGKSNEELQEENEIFAAALKNFPVAGGKTKDYLYGKPDGVANKPWFKKYAKEKGLTEPFKENDIMNAVFENAASDNPDSSAQKVILKLSEVVEKTTADNMEQMAKKFNLPVDEMQRVMDTVGMHFKGTASSRRDVMAEVHRDVVGGIQNADSKYEDAYPSNPEGDNGPHQQAYVKGFLKRMHFDSYIMGTRDGVSSQNIGGDNVEPQHYRECLAELTGFDGDTTTEEGRNGLVEHLSKRVRISPDNDSISFETTDGKVVKLGVDKYRTKGDSKGVLGSLGKDLKTCLKGKSSKK